MNVQLGLKANKKQFILLVIVNAFVGGMIGLERSILPQIAEVEFHLAAKTAILSFIVVFGIVKAFTNYFTGALANRLGRKNLLVLGWLLALPVPLILINAESWNWIIFANVLLGIHQGLAWSSTVVMKIDLVGEKDRGLAMGLNEFAGYIAVACMAFLTGFIASHYGVRPYPFYIGIVLSVVGLLITLIWVKDTQKHVDMEMSSSDVPRLKRLFFETTVLNRNLGSVTQAGLINNLNDGMAWGLFPMLLAEKNFSLSEIGVVTAVYPAVWGIGQLFTGKMSDYFCKKSMLFWGMFLQGLALLFFVFASELTHYIVLSVILGWGTAMVYPTFLATIAENTHPADRAKSLGVFRLWRDLGYAIGAVLTGFIADAFGLNTSIFLVGVITIASSVFIQNRMRCKTTQPKLLDWIFNREKKTGNCNVNKVVPLTGI
ncbi:MAG: MFS transporter [Bacteroidetes bacterium]|nr:MFS transporter [Bacteroidota bacterium]